MSCSDDYFIRASDIVNKQFVKAGAFGDVHKGFYFEKPVAIKEIKIASAGKERVLRELQLEVDVLRNARHPNVVLFMGANFTESKPFIVTEYATLGNLEEVLKRGNLDQAIKLKFADDVALGMMYLHGRKPKIAHLDLKPDNLLVFSENTIKICDFGLSRRLGPEDATSTLGGRGSPHYMAPECIDVTNSDDHRSKLSHKSDVFSFAMVLFRMFAGQHPFRTLLPEGRPADWLQVFMARQNNPTWRPTIPADPAVHPGIWEIVQQCWHPDPAARPPFEQILVALRQVREQVYPGTVPGRASAVSPSPSLLQQPPTTLSPSGPLRAPATAGPPALPPSGTPIHASAGTAPSLPSASLPASSTASGSSLTSLPLTSLPSNATVAPPLAAFFPPGARPPPRPPSGSSLVSTGATASDDAPPSDLLSAFSSLTAPATPSLNSLRARYSAIPAAEFDRLAALFTKCDVYYTGCVTSATLQTWLRAQDLPSPTTQHLAARLRNRAIIFGADELLSLDNLLQHAHATCLALDDDPPPYAAADPHPAAPYAPPPAALASMPSSSTHSAYGGRYPYLPDDYIAELKIAFARLDRNNDGKLLREEILEYAAEKEGEDGLDFATKLLQQLKENRLVTYFTVDQLLESANRAAYEFHHTGDSSAATTLPFPLDSSHFTSSGSLASGPAPTASTSSPRLGGDGGSAGVGGFDMGRMRDTLDRGGAAGGPPKMQELEAKYRARLGRDEICDWWRYFCELDSQRDGVLTRTEVMAAHWSDANGNQVMEEDEIDAAAGPLLQLVDNPRRPVTFPVFLAWAADTRQPPPPHALNKDVKHLADQSPFAQNNAPRGATLVRSGAMWRGGEVARSGTDKLVFEQLRDILGSEPSTALSDADSPRQDHDDHGANTDDSSSLGGSLGGGGEEYGTGNGSAGGKASSGPLPEAIRPATSVPNGAAAAAISGRSSAPGALASAPVAPGHGAGGVLRRGAAPPVHHPPNLADLQAQFQVPLNTILAHWSLFRKVDVNGDGQASIEELEAALHKKDLEALFVSLMYMFEQSEGRGLSFPEFLQLALEAKAAPMPRGRLDVETLASMSSRQLLQAFLKRMKRKLLR